MNPLKFVRVAEAMASMSKDPSTQVGAVAIDDDGLILATGYNGFPRGVLDFAWRYHDKAEKYPRIVHAEQNLIAMAARHGIRLLGSTVIVTALYPCSECTKLMIQAGVVAVYAPVMDASTNPLWMAEGELSLSMMQEAGLTLHEYDPVALKVGDQPSC